MAKVTAPLLSFGGSGSIADAMTFSRWKGRPYVRQKVTPANPQSAAQTLTRNAFALANAMWKTAPAEFTQSWDLFATGQVLTGRNAYVSSFVKNCRGETDLEDMIFSPGAKGGIAASSVTPTAGDDQVTVALVAPVLPSGWLINNSFAAVAPDVDPSTVIANAIVAGSDNSDPYSINITGLLDATDYVGGGWFGFQKADGTQAYGISTQFTFTTT